jgi:hypothetical protein
MKKVVKFFPVLALFATLGAPQVAHATSYAPIAEEHRQLKEKQS